ncbi:MAG: PAS domain-containing protein [Candidatus Zixiibacteriota bacterium]
MRYEAAVLETTLKEAISFETGDLSEEDVQAIPDNLPVVPTFVDRNDQVRYFSQTEERIFVRTKAVIGLKVQQCHPQKSLQVVNQILDDFKNGQKDKADFWINLQGKLILIRYFAVRGKNGEYLGCLEVTQDITQIKKIEGEKRLW